MNIYETCRFRIRVSTLITLLIQVAQEETDFCCLHAQILFTKVEIKDYAVVDYAD